MIVCIDTNVLIQARAANHRYGAILDSIMLGRMQWALSNRVLHEYREIMLMKCGATAWNVMDGFIDLVERSGDVVRVSPHFQFHVIVGDADDNAFTDCAIAAHADYVITDDKHFAPLANAGYKPQPITPEKFMDEHRGVHV
jgi:uncharacterized protein